MADAVGPELARELVTVVGLEAQVVEMAVVGRSRPRAQVGAAAEQRAGLGMVVAQMEAQAVEA